MRNKANHPRFIQPYLTENERVQEEADTSDDIQSNHQDDVDDVDPSSSDDELIDLKKKIEKEKKSKEVNAHVMKMLRDNAGETTSTCIWFTSDLFFF